jgi:TRAP-type C4-dicarboxylate transport system permease small subunit
MSFTKPSHLFFKILQSLSTYLAYLGAFSLFLMMSITIVDVAGRGIFNKPLLGAYELTEFLVLILIFSFLGYTQRKKSHISVDLFMMFFPEKLKVYIEIFNHLACLAIMILITWMGMDKALEMMSTGEATANLALPIYPFVTFLVLGCAIMCIEFILDVFKLFRGEKELTDK